MSEDATVSYDILQPFGLDTTVSSNNSIPPKPTPVFETMPIYVIIIIVVGMIVIIAMTLFSLWYKRKMFKKGPGIMRGSVRRRHRTENGDNLRLKAINEEWEINGAAGTNITSTADQTRLDLEHDESVECGLNAGITLNENGRGATQNGSTEPEVTFTCEA